MPESSPRGQESPVKDGGGHYGSRPAFVIDDVALAINTFVAADRRVRAGDAEMAKERRQHLRKIQGRFWRMFNSVLVDCLARRKGGPPEFFDDERLFLDMGLVDADMLGGDKFETRNQLVRELGKKGTAGCYHVTEWLALQFQQGQLENSLSGASESSGSYASKLAEGRRRVLDRMAGLLTGLPGIPLEISESMRSGNLDNIILSAGAALLREPKRRELLRRRNLWQLREQILAKARARVTEEASLRLFDLLNDIYARDWRERYEAAMAGGGAAQEDKAKAPAEHRPGDSVPGVGDADSEGILEQARRMRCHMILERAIDGDLDPCFVLNANGPRLTKETLADMLPLMQTFDRSLSELPPILVVPGSGRGFFAWDAGYAMVPLCPLVGVDDSVATAFAWQRMLDDRMNRGGAMRQAYERTFPGSSFKDDFPADYRAWFCRVAKGDAGAMSPERRSFFREVIGPDLSKPLLPPNLRNIGAQTVAVICRRLERQIAVGEDDINIRRRLAALYWLQGNLEAAGEQYTAAMAMVQDDGELLFAAGMFMRARSENDAANECFRQGAERAPKNLWGVYCQDALANMF